MPYPLNNVSTLPDYSEALTVRFGYPNPAFSCIVLNAAVYYQIAPYSGLVGGEQFTVERFSPPGNLNFTAATDLQNPRGAFSAIRFRSAFATAPAFVTVS